MESNRKYSAGLMSQSFWFVEFRHYLRLKKENISDDEIKRRITEENLFGAPNECRAHRIGNYLSARAGRMSQEELVLFFACDITSQKLINLICIMRQDRLLFEFINEVYREKVMLGAETIDLSDGRAFFTEKEKQDDTISGWQDKTKRRLISTYLNFMTDAGLLSRAEKVSGSSKSGSRKITIPLPDEALQHHLETTGETTILKAIMGVY